MMEDEDIEFEYSDMEEDQEDFIDIQNQYYHAKSFFFY